MIDAQTVLRAINEQSEKISASKSDTSFEVVVDNSKRRIESPELKKFVATPAEKQ